MIQIIPRTPFAPVFQRTGDASFWFSMLTEKSGKRIVKEMGYTSANVVSLLPLVEPEPSLLWADVPTNSIRRTDAMVMKIGALGLDPEPAAIDAIINDTANQVPKSRAWNNHLEALLLTALGAKVVIPKPSAPVTGRGIYHDLQKAGMLSEFDVRGMARFLAGIGVVENFVVLADGRTVNLTSLVLPDSQPVMAQLQIKTLEPLWNLCESVGFYGIIPYVWIFGLLDFKTFCDRVQMYWPEKADRERFVFQELPTAILAKQSVTLTEAQVDQLMKNVL